MTVPTLRFLPVLVFWAVSIGVGVFLQGAEAQQPAELPHKSSETAGGAADSAVPHAESPWSQAVKGLQARIVLKWTEVFEGTPIISTFLELRNVSHSANPMKLAWRREKMKLRVVDAQGHEPLPAGGAHSGPVVERLDLLLPYRGALSFDASMGGLGIYGDKAGQLETWVFDRADKDYYLRVVLEIPGSKRGNDEFAVPWEGKIEIPPVLVPLKRAKLDPAKVAPLIQELGGKMLADDWDASEDALRALSLIDDPRVIPWYVKAMDTDSYELKYAAFDRLARFNSDAALEGIKKGMRLREDAKEGGKHRDTPAASVSRARDDNDRNRHLAALALLRSPHPQAKKLLLTMWNDPYREVRVVVLDALHEMCSQESLDLLKKMSHDCDEGVRSQASEYLESRSEKPAAEKK
jgi:hypothetical protein